SSLPSCRRTSPSGCDREPLERRPGGGGLIVLPAATRRRSTPAPKDRAGGLVSRRLSYGWTAAGGSWCAEHDLVAPFAALEHPMRLGGLLQRQLAPLLHPQGAGRE